MKLIKYFFIITIMFVSNILFAQKKIALIVAIGKYPPEQRYWKNLSSERDLIHIKDALIKNGFAAKNIQTLVNEKATKQGMINALNKLADNAMSGDIVYFHFSGHGQQIQDDATDGYLDEADGYDEALIPYDAKGRWDLVDYHGEKHFRDDLLDEKLTNIRKKVGTKGSVVVVLDACHSGTATRSAGIVRGVPEPLQSNNYQPKNTLEIGRTENSFLTNLHQDLGSLVVFSGSSPNQPNRETVDDEGKNVGSLSYAFAKSITNLSANSNYKFLFDHIKAKVQANDPTQIPMFEGNGALAIFSNQYIPLKETIIAEMRFNNKQYNNDTTFIIQRGLFNNIYEGTTLNVYELGTNILYCNATIKEVSNFQSICVANKKLNAKKSYEVKIANQNFGVLAASYLIQNNANASLLAKQISNYLMPQYFLTTSNNPDFTINISSHHQQYIVQLIARNDSIRYTATTEKQDTLSIEILEDFVAKIKREMSIAYLRKMQDGGNLYNATELSLITFKQDDNANETIFYPNDSFALKIKSNYDGVLYYTIIDILPDNDIKVLIPDSLQFSYDADYSLRKGQEKIINLFTDETSITGKEYLKIIFSPYPIDLRPTFASGNVKARSKKAQPLEKMMDELFTKDKNITTRSSSVKMDDIAIKTVSFTLVKTN